MASGIDFRGSNITMLPPVGAEGEVAPVKAFRNPLCCVTCWQLTEAEQAEVARTGRVYLSLYGGGMQPAFVGAASVVREHVAQYGETFPDQETH